MKKVIALTIIFSVLIYSTALADKFFRGNSDFPMIWNDRDGSVFLQISSIRILGNNFKNSNSVVVDIFTENWETDYIFKDINGVPSYAGCGGAFLDNVNYNFKKIQQNTMEASAYNFLVNYLKEKQNKSTDYYVGTYDNGEKAYLMTGTISKYSIGDSAGFSCKVKSVKNNGKFSYVDYKFMTEPSQGITKNGVTLGQGQTGQLLRNKNSVEYNIWNYFIKNYSR